MYKKTTLENGIRILVEEIPHVRSATLGIWVDVGSRDESEEFNGISHFIEHMMFKGTEKRTARDIAETLDAVGGQLNAFTTKEYTCYYARVLDEHFNLALDILSDMLLNSRFAEKDIEKEKNVIIEEIKMYEDSPDELVHDVLTETLWEGHSLGRPIIGNEKVIRDMDRDKVMRFYRNYYIPSRIVIAVAGNVKYEEVVEKIEEKFGMMEHLQIEKELIRPFPHFDIAFRKKDTEQVHLCVGAPGLELKNKDIYKLQVFNALLGGGVSSRLFQQMRELRGLVYSVYSYHTSYHDTGLFCIYAGLSKQNVKQALELIFQEIFEIQNKGIGEDELKRIKDQLKGNLLLSLESVSTRMSRLGKSELYLREVKTPDEIVNKINKVTVEDVKDIARKMFSLERFSLGAVGPWDEPIGLESNLQNYLGKGQ